MRQMISVLHTARRCLQTARRLAVDMDPNILSSGSVIPRISHFGSQGFTVDGVTHTGSIILVSNLHLLWKVNSSKDITKDALMAIELHHPRPEILVIGTGDKVELIDQSVRQHLRDLGILLEVQDTRHACATYNFLAEEGRLTAAALLPPATFVPEAVRAKFKSRAHQTQ
eukprot:m.93163 g.93163  ORF g.93163 m.93163 type:complete len:170 (-) comp14690_c1_seq2:237-746(-)